ncbi:unnamed protein product [Nezara viridula]|uniref:Uncharacterized protein n=1 Tax=Nezara viridula TaxID=85310 RepID=A0A9P0HIR6_NEZVI|nr:unnamed protein product [Nezara viridula]
MYVSRGRHHCPTSSSLFISEITGPLSVFIPPAIMDTGQVLAQHRPDPDTPANKNSGWTQIGQVGGTVRTSYNYHKRAGSRGTRLG